MFRRTAITATRRLLILGACLFGLPAAPAHALDLTQYSGKVVVVDFWASWCVPCRQSFPWLNAMYDEYTDDGLVILGVNTDVDAAEAQQFLEDYPAKFEIVYDHGELRRMKPRPHHADTNSGTTLRFTAWAVALLGTTVLTACANLGVEPWERDYLAREEMLLDGDPVDDAMDDHI